jgi:hypothetical protein
MDIATRHAPYCGHDPSFIQHHLGDLSIGNVFCVGSRQLEVVGFDSISAGMITVRDTSTGEEFDMEASEPIDIR